MSARVLFVTQTAYTGGGIEEWLWTLYTELHSTGWDCVVGLAKGAQFHRPADYLKQYPFGNHFEIDGSRGYVEQRRAELFRRFREYDPDIIVCFNLADALYAAVEWKVNCKNNVRIVCVIHSLSASILNDARNCVANIDMIGCVSKRAGQLLKELCGPVSSNIRHLPTGVPAPLRRSSWSETPFTAGYVGRLDVDEKRVLDLIGLIRALDDHPGFHFEIAGLGNAENELKAALRPYIDTGRVVFHGQVSREYLYQEIYPRLQALLLFSPAEGGPIVVWEAMRHGVVPVVSDFSGRKEEGVVLPNKNALVFDVGSFEDAAKALIRLRSDSHFWKTLSDRAVGLPKEYHLETFGARWAEAFKEVLEQPVRLDCSVNYRFEATGRLNAVIPSSRLRLFLRKMMRRSFDHTDAGGEWPHSYNGRVG